jgi:hypothetical protein
MRPDNQIHEAVSKLGANSRKKKKVNLNSQEYV